MLFLSFQIIRAPDPSLFLVYQDSNCTSTEAESYPDCVKEKAMNLGSQEVLGMSLLKIKEGMDFEGILSKRFVAVDGSQRFLLEY